MNDHYLYLGSIFSILITTITSAPSPPTPNTLTQQNLTETEKKNITEAVRWVEENWDEFNTWDENELN